MCLFTWNYRFKGKDVELLSVPLKWFRYNNVMVAQLLWLVSGFLLVLHTSYHVWAFRSLSGNMQRQYCRYPLLVVYSWSLRRNLVDNFGGGVRVGAKSTVIIKNSVTYILHPIKRRVFSFFCVYTAQIFVLKKKINFLSSPLQQLGSQQKLFLGRKNIEVHLLLLAPPKLRLR